MSAVLANTERLTQAGAEVFERLPETIDQMEATMTDVRLAAAKFRETSQTLGEASLTTQQEIIELRRNIQPGLDALLRQIETTSGVVEDLARRLRRDPAQLLRGAMPQEPGPGEP